MNILFTGNVKTVKTFLTYSTAFFVIFCAQKETFSAGVTLITHGNNGNADSWVLEMAKRIPTYHSFPGQNSTRYKVYLTETNGSYIPKWERQGNTPFSSDSGELLVLLDWRQFANTSNNTFDVANLFANIIVHTNFIHELGGHALAELPLHFIGHSRGGSLIAELCKILGTNGVWIDHQTSLDAYALESDAPIQTYENVLFHDNIWQGFWFNAHGSPIDGAYNRNPSYLFGGYWPDYFGDHSDIHLWYHGTIALETPTSDSLASIQTVERLFWWNTEEQNGAHAGFRYSLIGGGNRTSTAKPGGSNQGKVLDGFNQRFDLGSGTTTNNRVDLPTLLDAWPNPIRFNLVGTNAIVPGANTTASLFYQYADNTNTPVFVSSWLDVDANPWNSNSLKIYEIAVPKTSRSSVVRQTIAVPTYATNAPGTYRLYTEIAAGGKRRFLYAPELLTLIGDVPPPHLAITKNESGTITLSVNGTIEQRFVLEASSNLVTWQALETNTLVNSYRTYTGQPSHIMRFYRTLLR